MAEVKYALSKDLAGVMVWGLMQDTTSSALMNTIATCMPKPVNTGDPSTYNFENGTQGWTTSTPYTTVGTSTTEKFLGSRSLSVGMGKLVQGKQD